MLQAEDGGLDVTRTHRSPSRNSQQSNISSLSTVSTPVTSSSNKTPTPSRRGSGCGQGGDPGEVTPQATPTHSRQASLRSRDRSRRGSGSGSGTQTPTPRNSVGGPEAEANGVLVNGDAGGEEVKHKVNGNTSPLKSKHVADGSNNNDIDSIPCV